MSREHITDEDKCWCKPNMGDGVVVHRDDLEYALYELTLIGDILVDYDGNRNADDLMSLCDEIRERAYKAIANLRGVDDETE